MISDTVYRRLVDIVGKDYCTRQAEDLACYAYDATAQQYLPDAVVFPENAEQIAGILSMANQEGFYVIPRGAGSGMTGGCLPVRRGVIVAMSRMNKILNIEAENLTAKVQPGVVTADFHRAVEQKGLFYPPDPASSEFSTLGGNLAECAGGPRAVKYGVTRDYVLGLEVVLPTGEILHTGVKTAKGVVGYDLTRLLVGSEGTLGIITETTLRLIPLPESVGTVSAFFRTLRDAGKCVSEIIRRGMVPRTIEFMDKDAIQCVESYLEIGLPEDAGSMLLMDVDGENTSVSASLEKLSALCGEMGADQVKQAKTAQEAAQLWKARKAISPALFRLAPHKINEDIVVPRNKIPDMVEIIEELKNKTGLTIVSFGHAGDGNIHFNIMLNKKNENEVKKAEEAIEYLFDYTLKLGGTISGEHGIGITKSAFLRKELGSIEVDMMKKIKDLFDPNGILNPGKIFSDPS